MGLLHKAIGVGFTIVSALVHEALLFHHAANGDDVTRNLMRFVRGV
ncbi:hypothetical protein [Mycobacterium sp.]|nr:hypothetical protein [Mycobacterium sp.]